MTFLIRPLLVLSISLGILTCVHADLVLTNFTTTKPMKIMAIGDSITDDCSVNGAWRAPLQTMLEANGFPFTFVGRQVSTAFPSFSKVRHEGYCGAVVAPPGVFAAHQYSTTDNYVQKIVADALFISGNKPDAALVLIGANDIGRGRDPYQVGTNDMAKLLDLIFSNSANTHVIFAKASTLQNGSVGGLSYGDYATNVPIYNAVLQTLVNQRQALGQNVFLADMFSAVDYNTMFMADHVHPSSLGLQAIAREWLARLQAITLRTNLLTSTLINGGANWKYNDSGQDLGTNWAQPNYDDSGWSNGVARLGYGDPATATTISFGPEPTNKFITTYFRRSFVVPWNAVITNLNFRLARADGALVWLNGQQLYRTNLPAGTISSTNLARTAMTLYTRPIFYPTNVAVTNLPTGTNWVAVEIHLNSATNSAMGFDLELLGSGYWLPLPSLSIAQSGSNISLSWPITNGATFMLYATTNLAAPGSWTATPALLQTNGPNIIASESVDVVPKYFRLQRP